MVELKICKRCGVEKDLPSFRTGRNVCTRCANLRATVLYKRPESRAKKKAYRQKEFVATRQKEYMKAYNKEYQKRPNAIKKQNSYEYKEIRRMQSLAYSASERGRQVSKQWRIENRNYRIEYHKEYRKREGNKEHRKEYWANFMKEKARIREHDEKRVLYKREYKQKPEMKAYYREYNKKFGGDHDKRAKKRGCHAEKVNRIDIFTRDKFKCAYCKKKLKLEDCVLDHKIPIVKGGSNTPENCTTSCQPCNSAKHAKLLNGIQISIFNKLKE